MTIRAERDPRFYFRFILIGLGAVAFALWALYDGAIGYHKKRDAHIKVYQQYVDQGREDLWDDYAVQNELPIDKPGSEHEVKHFDASIKTQYSMAVGAALVSLIFFFIVWNSRGRWIEWNNRTLTSSWGQTVTMDQVESLEKRQWAKKGIAKLRYSDGGSQKTFVIDDFKFKRQPTDEILVEIEKVIGHDKITGGPPEGFEFAAGEEAAQEESPAQA
jgi:hypothetical protein